MPAAPPETDLPQPPHDAYDPVPRRRRVLIALLAVATAGVVIAEMASRAGIVRHAREASQHRADVPACKPGETAGCVGSRTEVIAVPPAPAAASGAIR